MFVSKTTGSPSLNLPRDTSFRNTVLLIHGDGTSGANNTLYIDSSRANTYIPFNNTFSNYFNGSTDGLITTSSTYNLSNNWTMECWFYAPTGPISGGSILMDCRPTTTNGYYPQIGISSNTNIGFYFNGTDHIVTVPDISNKWNHVAAVKNGNNLNLYLNGANVYYTTDTNNWAVGANRPVIALNGYNNSLSYFPGYISNARIVNGTSVYTSDFTPPTTPLTSIPGTAFLSCQSSRFIDNALNATITTTGSPTISSGGPAIIPFGKTSPGTFTPYPTIPSNGWSVSFNGSSDYLTVSPAAASTGNFTMEFWLFNNNTWSSNFDITDGASGALTVYFNSGNFRIAPQLSASLNLGSVSSLSIGQWHHFVVIKSGGNIRGYADGVALAAAQADAAGYNAFTKIGGTADGYFNGFISNFRYVTNANIYDINSSTYTVPTSPLSVVANTQLLTCQSYRFVGANTTVSNVFITTAGTPPSTQSFSPFAPTRAYSKDRVSGSVYYNGTTDYIQSGQYLQSLTPGANDFTLECWIYPTAGATRYDMIDLTASAGNNRIQLLYDTSGNLAYYSGVGSPAAAIINVSITDAVFLNRWNHVALSRNSNTARLYLNGTLVGNSADTSVWTSPLRLTSGKDGAGSTFIKGYVGDLRILNGTGLYPSAFTPPTTPLSAIGNTVLLINSTNSGIIDQTSKNNIATWGTSVSTTQNKFGGSSMVFNGTSNYLYLPKTDILRPIGAFTYECWVYPLVQLSGTGIFSGDYPTVGQPIPIAVYGGTGGGGGTGSTLNAGFYSGAAWTEINSSTSLTLNTWQHLAVTYDGTTLRLFLNGVIIASSAISWTSYAFQSGFYIGRRWDTTGTPYFNGYIDEFRVSKFARYTANFTPPAQKFQDR